MNNLRTAAQQALEALEALQGGCTDHDDGTVEAITVWCPEIIDALRAALAEPVQEPVAWTLKHEDGHWNTLHADVLAAQPEWVRKHWASATPLYTAPPQRKPLSGIEVERLLEQVIGSLPVARKLIRAVEAAHGIKEGT